MVVGNLALILSVSLQLEVMAIAQKSIETKKKVTISLKNLDFFDLVSSARNVEEHVVRQKLVAAAQWLGQS